MKIAVNTRLLLPGKLEGIGWFTYETLKRVTRDHPEHEFHFIFDRPYSKEFIFSDNVIPHIAYPQARHPVLWYLFFEYGLPHVVKKIKPDLFLSTDGWIPLHLPVPVVNVIHDLNFVHHPEFIKPVVQAYYDRFFRKFAQKATRLATVSEFSKQDLHQSYQIPLENIDVVYNGVNTKFRPFTEKEQEEVRQQYTAGTPFFLFVGLIHKRKNLDNIFKAFDRFKENDATRTKFIVVGEKKWWRGDIEDAYLEMKHKEDVIFLGRQGMETLTSLMASATALLYPSLFEGFGIPIIEAFQAETAVITSNLTSMPEISGGAALCIDPYSVAEIEEAMRNISTDFELRKMLINKGKQRRNIYSWERSAKLLWECIERCFYR